MKRASVAVLGLILSVAIAGDVSAQGRRGGGRGQQPAITTLAGDIQADWARTRQLITGIADAMPEDKYNAKPTPAEQSFGERVMHIVQTDLGILQALGGKTAAPTVNTKATSKADIAAALKQSFDYGEAVIKEFNDQQWNERVMPPPFMGPSASRIRIVYFDMQHTEDIYGQLVVYLRLNGGVPPASRPRNAPPEP
jgi:uncharacterized damage-inducible protein DinB